MQQQSIETKPITPLFRELPAQPAAAALQDPADPATAELALAEQMRQIEREEEPERWDGLS